MLRLKYPDPMVLDDQFVPNTDYSLVLDLPGAEEAWVGTRIAILLVMGAALAGLNLLVWIDRTLHKLFRK